MNAKNLQIQLSWIQFHLLKAGSLAIEKAILKSNQIFKGLSYPARRWDESKPEYVAGFITFLQNWIEKENPDNICVLLIEFEKLVNI